MDVGSVVGFRVASCCVEFVSSVALLRNVGEIGNNEGDRLGVGVSELFPGDTGALVG